MAKGNKELLARINNSINIIKRIEAGEVFSKEEKHDILSKYIGADESNNSYWTPIEICNWIKQLLDINTGEYRIADFSAGIGNMVIPFIEEYGKLQEGITFDLFEYDSNTSAALKTAWSDYEQVNVYGNFDSIARCDEIPDNAYDFVIGNPPFSGSVPYMCEWNNNKGKIKNNNICDAFVDMAIRKIKIGGYIALVLPSSHMYKSNATAKLRQWMKSQVALRAVIPLDADTFAESGVQGANVGTCIFIYEKGAVQGKVFVAELTNNKDVVVEMKALAYQFRLFMSNEYDIEYTSDCYRGTYGKLKQRVKQWGESL